MGNIISINHLSPFALFYLAKCIAESENWMLFNLALEREISSIDPQYRLNNFSLVEGTENGTSAEEVLRLFFDRLMHYQLSLKAIQYALYNIGMEDIARELEVFQTLFHRYRRPSNMKQLFGWWSSFFGWL